MDRHTVSEERTLIYVPMARELLAAHGFVQSNQARVAMAGDRVPRVEGFWGIRRALSHCFVVFYQENIDTITLEPQKEGSEKT